MKRDAQGLIYRKQKAISRNCSLCNDRFKKWMRENLTECKLAKRHQSSKHHQFTVSLLHRCQSMSECWAINCLIQSFNFHWAGWVKGGFILHSLCYFSPSLCCQTSEVTLQSDILQRYFKSKAPCLNQSTNIKRENDCAWISNYIHLGLSLYLLMKVSLKSSHIHNQTEL